MKKNKIILVLILLIAAFLRFWKLDQYPALNADEAAIGYNAYSLIQTGKDEHGNPWPIHFQSFNDHKPGLYFYIVLPFVKFFGLNEWAVRVPGAFLGVVTVFLVYLLANTLFPKKQIGNPSTSLGPSALRLRLEEMVSHSALSSWPKGLSNHWKLEVGHFASFLLAVSPWHIHFSRGGWEANVATFFIILGVWLFLKSLISSKYLVLSLLSFVLSLYTYHAARIVVPLLGLGLLVIYRNSLRENLKNYLIAGFLGLVILVPLIKDLMGPPGISRAAGVGLFVDPGPLARINEQRGEHKDFRSFPAVILHNKAVNYGLAFLENWADHFHGEFLFLSGDVIQRSRIPETGQLYIFDGLWLLIGVWWMVKNQNKGIKLVLWWLIVAPTAAALTFQSPHALRTQNMVIPLTIISALGLTKIIEVIRDMRYAIRIVSCVLLVAIIIWGFVRYEHMYWVHMAKEYPFSSQYGVKELVDYVKESGDKFEKVIVTDRYDQPYILFLFYLKYSPDRFQNEHVLTLRDKFGFSTVREFGKYEFRPIDFDIIRPENPNSLIVGTDEEIPKEANIVKEIYGSNDYKYFEVVAN